MNIVASLDTNLMMPGDIPQLTPDSIKSRIHGSKLVLVVEQSMICTTWGCKVCLLLLYHKLTFGLRQQLAVKIIGGYVTFGFILMESLYFGFGAGHSTSIGQFQLPIVCSSMEEGEFPS